LPKEKCFGYHGRAGEAEQAASLRSNAAVAAQLQRSAPIEMRNSICLSLLLIAFVADAQDSGVEIACSSIETVDFNNASIIVGRSPEVVTFKSGKACPINRFSGKCDWEHTITMDKILHPNSAVTVRLLVINRNHLTGSGAWDHLNLYICKNGSVKSIFEAAYLYGAKLHLKNDMQFAIKSGQWQDKDPTCCPSREKEELFLWNSHEEKYVVINSKLSEVN
jgi:hypothetical protein